MTETAYNNVEAEKIDSLPWYNDSRITKLIVGRLRTKKGGCLLDLCCGTSKILTHLVGYFSEYVGVDRSPVMLSKANYNIKSCQLASKCAVELIKDDVYNFLRYNPRVGTATHVLIKNSLQFLDIRDLFRLLKSKLCGGVRVLIVQTVNINDSDSSDVFKSLLTDLYFTKRIKKHLSAEEIVNESKTLAKSKIRMQSITQEIDVTLWLEFHGINKPKINEIVDRLSCLEDKEMVRYGITKRSNLLYLLRKQAVIDFDIR